MNDSQPTLQAVQDRGAAVKQRAEDLAMELLGNGLVTDDPALAEACAKLRPYQAKLAGVSRDMVSKGLALVEVADPFGDQEWEAKRCLLALLVKLEAMVPMLGLF